MTLDRVLWLPDDEAGHCACLHSDNTNIQYMCDPIFPRTSLHGDTKLASPSYTEEGPLEGDRSEHYGW